ncbi:hypothetical protein FRC12_009542 [Ceratobasidium sp. 428]|nr:hypothetical protein FRC12_009542 [Ceratobasidium sp. 428]
MEPMQLQVLVSLPYFMNTFILPPEQAKEAFHALADVGMRKFNISGGERLLNPISVGEILNLARPGQE